MHLLPALGFGSAGLDLGIHKPLRHQPHECISARVLNAFAPAHSGSGVWGHVGLSHGDLGMQKTASSQHVRMQFGTDFKCIRFSCSGLGVWGHVGPLHQTTYTAIRTRSSPIKTQIVRVAGWTVLVEQIESDSGFRFQIASGSRVAGWPTKPSTLYYVRGTSALSRGPTNPILRNRNPTVEG